MKKGRIYYWVSHPNYTKVIKYDHGTHYKNTEEVGTFKQAKKKARMIGRQLGSTEGVIITRLQNVDGKRYVLDEWVCNGGEIR